MKLWLVLVLCAGTAYAQSSPGPLAASHEQLQCASCHVNNTPALSNTSCVACHGQLLQRGLHVTPPVQTKLCWECHGDHKGRSFDLQAWRSIGGVKQLDHAAQAGWALQGKHAIAACTKCHTATLASGATKFIGLDTKCVSCHAPPKHQAPMFDQRPCEWCHAPTYKTFKAYGFDHDEKTKFPLEAGHRVQCIKCHTPAVGIAKPSTRCEDCHTTVHGKRFDNVPGGCAACHTGAKWTLVTASTFKHDKYPLFDHHREVRCRGCHRGTSPMGFERLGNQRTCKECHAHATVHADAANPKGKFTSQQCESCHLRGPTGRPPGRNVVTMFHGPNSTFPLRKGHRDVPCAQCHTQVDKKGKTRFDKTSRECGDCHADSAHKGALGKECTKCHVSGEWAAIAFDHQAQFPDGRAFVLAGEHMSLGCDACHGADQQFSGTPRSCVGCHATDDAHRGKLGTDCERCHQANGDNTFTHAMARFKLDGGHVGLPCDDCHLSRDFKPRPRECAGCHPEPRVHYRQYGTWCVRCHTTTSWKPR